MKDEMVNQIMDKCLKAPLNFWKYLIVVEALVSSRHAIITDNAFDPCL